MIVMAGRSCLGKRGMYMIWILFALGSAFFAGITAVLAKSVWNTSTPPWPQPYAPSWCWGSPG